MTDIRTAILKAADHIEAHPELYDFSATKVPDCGTPGCALGWIAVFRGRRAHMPSGERACFSTCGNPADVSSDRFYGRMDRVASRGDQIWRDNYAACARALRAYADRYHPATTSQPPDWQQLASQLATQPPIPADA